MAFRKSPLVTAVATNTRLAVLVAEHVPQYAALTSIAARAEGMITELEAEQQRQQPQPAPSKPKDLDAWLAAEVDRRLAQGTRSVRVDVLRSLLTATRADIDTLLNEHVDDVTRGLAGQLAETMHAVETHVAAMPDVQTAADAIEHGAHAHWKAVTDLAVTVDDIRVAQRQVNSARAAEFDNIACGDTPLVDDPEVRLYFHSRLDDVAPGWRSGVPVPWPTDPTERLVWCILHDSGAWVPTPAELNALLHVGPVDTPSMVAEPFMTRGNPATRKHEHPGPLGGVVVTPEARSVDQSGHGFDVAGRGTAGTRGAKPLRQTAVRSVPSPSSGDDED